VNIISNISEKLADKQKADNSLAALSSAQRMNTNKLLGLFIFLLFWLCSIMLVLEAAPQGASQTALFQSCILATAFYLSANIIYVIFNGNAKLQGALSKIKRDNKRFLLVWLSILVELFLILLLNKLEQFHPLFNAEFRLLIMPYMLAPMAVTILLGAGLGSFSANTVSLLGSIIFSGSQTDKLNFLVIAILVGNATVFVSRNIRKRSHLLRAGVYIGLAIILVNLAISLPSMGLSRFNSNLIVEPLAAFFTAVMLCILLSGILPVLEVIFRHVTPISWLELADLNHPLLRRLLQEAPGTFQHSYAVAQLAEAAAEKINCNATQCRVMAYFHDIGKIDNPQYFVENNSLNESSPHNELTPQMSANIIIKHVTKGLELANVHKLNAQIKAGIAEHHGTTLVGYFYNIALRLQEQNLGEENSSDDDFTVDAEKYRYPGPIPQSRESAILSLADPIESASRTLSKHTPQAISQLVEKIVAERLGSGQLDESGLTVNEIKAIKQSFAATLLSTLHTRIAYPEKTEDPKNEQLSFDLEASNSDEQGLRKQQTLTTKAAETSVVEKISAN